MVAAKLARRRCLAHAAVLALAGVASGRASGESAATIRIIVPLPAGGGVDVVARELAERIARATGATFVVENRPGAGTIIGTEAVARAAPDGHTLLLVPNSFVVAPQLHKVNYDAIAGFAPICSLVATPTTLVVNASSPYRTLGAFVTCAGSTRTTAMSFARPTSGRREGAAYASDHSGTSTCRRRSPSAGASHAAPISASGRVAMSSGMSPAAARRHSSA
jgi:tripartite-type tricarboxylate transporter receptor subunit TctC